MPIRATTQVVTYFVDQNLIVAPCDPGLFASCALGWQGATLAFVAPVSPNLRASLWARVTPGPAFAGSADMAIAQGVSLGEPAVARGGVAQHCRDDARLVTDAALATAEIACIGNGIPAIAPKRAFDSDGHWPALIPSTVPQSTTKRRFHTSSVVSSRSDRHHAGATRPRPTVPRRVQ